MKHQPPLFEIAFMKEINLRRNPHHIPFEGPQSINPFNYRTPFLAYRIPWCGSGAFSARLCALAPEPSGTKIDNSFITTVSTSYQLVTAAVLTSGSNLAFTVLISNYRIPPIPQTMRQRTMPDWRRRDWTARMRPATPPSPARIVSLTYFKLVKI